MDTLSDDMLLHLFSFLKTEDLNTMQLVSLQYSNLIEDHSGRLYSTRVLECHLYLGPMKCVFGVVYNRFSLYLHFDALQCTSTEIFPGRNESTDEEEQSFYRSALEEADFLSQTIDHCLERLRNRSGGIGTLELRADSSLHSPFFNNFEELIRTVPQLSLWLDNVDIPVEDAYRYIYSPRRSLTIYAIDRHPLVDDRLFTEAGSGRLELKSVEEQPSFLTANQLEIVLGRDDLDKVRIEYMGGPAANSCECLKSTIQRLLYSNKSVDITFCGVPWPEGREMLISIDGFLAERTIEGRNDNSSFENTETIFTYQHHHRVVTAKMYTYYRVNVEITC